MNAILERKKQEVTEISERLRGSEASVLVDYRGLNVDEITELRKQLREAGVDFKVYKNTLLRRATADTDLTELDEQLVGPTAVAFGYDDVITPAKVIYNFAKDHKALEIKAGVIEGEVTGLDQITALAQLPSREGLLSMLCNVLQAPVRNFALAAKAVAEQKEESA